ncbi:hypothetical protein [Lysinibacillus sphaericus]|uniref:Uncharacterized protein n=1 Tax=Lysinibacillus sphaericus OT4b.31 TaxID=1285586 RepID=R7ZFE3_LYSSH|nr:hypothetical protein [Lysinibacillus sphaericus]EON72850.1 hypothetical protein H131_09083 [Lysinibacillus sphaericus OT4b.31]
MDAIQTTAILELVIYKDRNISDELMKDFNGGITNVILRDEGGRILECTCMDSSVSSLILMDTSNEEEIELMKELNDTKFIYQKAQDIDIQYDSLIQLDDSQDNIYCVVELKNIIYLYNGLLRKSINDDSITSLKSLKEYLNTNYPTHKILERIS